MPFPNKTEKKKAKSTREEGEKGREGGGGGSGGGGGGGRGRDDEGGRRLPLHYYGHLPVLRSVVYYMNALTMNLACRKISINLEY